MIYLLYTLHIIVCLFLILVVLLQQGKGADLSVFGGGSTQTAFGARGAATVLHKLTVASFVAFIVTTIFIAAFQHQDEGGSVIGDDVDLPAAEETLPADDAEEATDEVPAGTTPATPDAGDDAGETGDAGDSALPAEAGGGDGPGAADSGAGTDEQDPQ